MITVQNTIKLYEVDGVETRPIEPPSIRVDSHWNRNDMVVLLVDGKSYSVVAKALIAAVNNATNTAKW